MHSQTSPEGRKKVTEDVSPGPFRHGNSSDVDASQFPIAESYAALPELARYKAQRLLRAGLKCFPPPALAGVRVKVGREEDV
jgi:hypothetical protein